MRIDENIVLLNLLTASAAITFGIDSLVCSIININLTVLVPLVELYNCGTREVVVAQLVERSLSIPEARVSNPVIGKNLLILNICILSTVY